MIDESSAGASKALAYGPDIETVEPDEAEAIDGIIAAMTHQSEVVAGREKHAVRASHAKSTGLLIGELTIAPGLPAELAQGLFSRPGTFEVAVRFAQGAGEILPDSTSTHRGMAIKVFGVEGEKIAGHSDDTQDFVLATGATFPSGTAQKFLKDEKQLEYVTALPDSVNAGIKAAASATARATNVVLQAVGSGGSSKAGFFGHPYVHPLGDSYHSQAPIRYGDYVAKMAAFPTGPDLQPLIGQKIDVEANPDGFRAAIVNYFKAHDATFDLKAQLWTDAETQPIEDTSVEWPEDESPYVTVATLKLPRQEAYSAARQAYFDDVMSFRPGHALAVHRPLGSVMRARIRVYAALSEFRHTRNAAPHEEPADPSRIPE